MKPPATAPMNQRRWGSASRWVIVAVVIAMAAALGAWGWWLRVETYHLATVQAGVLYRAGNRSERELDNALRQAKARTVIMLIDDDELGDPRKQQFRRELVDLRQRGINIVRIPVRLGGWPTAAQIKQFLAIVRNPSHQPVVVHCAQGVRRTGMFVAAWQMSDMGFDKPRAKAAIQSFGHSPSTTSDIVRFIDEYPIQGATRRSN